MVSFLGVTDDIEKKVLVAIEVESDLYRLQQEQIGQCSNCIKFMRFQLQFLIQSLGEDGVMRKAE